MVGSTWNEERLYVLHEYMTRHDVILVYVDIGLLASDTATLNFAFSGTTTNRLWEIKVSQIPCYNECSKDYQ